jgi:hypothetical protein
MKKSLHENLVSVIEAEKLIGGKGDNPSGEFKKWLSSPEGKKALARGMKTEKEHASDENVAREIATDHLKEDRKYYEKLAKVGLDEHFLVKAVDEAAMAFGGSTAVGGNPGDKGSGIPVMQPHAGQKMRFCGGKLKMGKPGKGTITPDAAVARKSSFAKGTL